MNRIVAYLNKNIVGEANTSHAILNQFKTDKSIITNQPSVVVFPRHTDDIRKTVKFCDQLALKGKPISVCARGYGNDSTGASITNGAIVSVSKYLNKLIDFDSEQSLIHVQAGIDLESINNLVSLNKLELPLNLHNETHSLGGLLSNGLTYPFTTKTTDLFEMIEQLEVVLANGELLQTRRLSKRELNKLIGKTSFEANIYRQIDKLIEDNQALIDKIDLTKHDNYGYNNIARVKAKDGSFDLSPLFVGSQGALGIISEAIIKLEAKTNHNLTGIMTFSDFDQAMDMTDQLLKLHPTELNFFDGRLFKLAKKQGNFFDYFQTLESDLKQSVQYLIYFEYKLKTKMAKTAKTKKITNLGKKNKSAVLFDDKSQIDSINNLSQMFNFIEDKNQNTSLLNGILIPRVEWRQMISQLSEIERIANQPLPFYGSLLTSVVNIHTSFNLSEVSQRQAAIKTLEYTRRMTESLKGSFCASGGEGQIKNLFMQQNVPAELAELYQQIKQIFDPNNTLNAKVKQKIDLKDIVTNIRTDYDNKFYR